MRLGFPPGSYTPIRKIGAGRAKALAPNDCNMENPRRFRLGRVHIEKCSHARREIKPSLTETGLKKYPFRAKAAAQTWLLPSVACGIAQWALCAAFYAIRAKKGVGQSDTNRTAGAWSQRPDTQHPAFGRDPEEGQAPAQKARAIGGRWRGLEGRIPGTDCI